MLQWAGADSKRAVVGAVAGRIEGWLFQIAQSIRGANTGLAPAQTAIPAHTAQRRINKIVKVKGLS
jgi:hypothetical protein